MKKKSHWLSVLKQTFKSWNDDDISFLSASLAYYTTFSLVPLIVICIYIAGLFFGKEAVTEELLNQFQNTFGPESVEQIKTMISKSTNPTKNIFSQVVGIIILILAASGVFGALQIGLNAVWHVKPSPDRGIIAFIKDRFLSFSMVLGVGFLLLVSLVFTVIITATSDLINSYVKGGEIIGLVLNYFFSIAIITVLFAMMFKYLPDVKNRWRDVWLGAFITTLLFTLGKFLIGIYLGYSDTASEFGAAGSLILILIWVFYSAQIFFLGAEFTKAYTMHKGRPIIPTKNAVAVSIKH